MRARTIVAPLASLLLWPALPGSAQQQDFPDGPGKSVFVAACGGCHDINRARAGYRPEGWRTVITMMKNVAAPVPADQWDVLTDYVIKSFPERPRPAAVVIDGPQQVRLRVWQGGAARPRPPEPVGRTGGRRAVS